MAEIYVPNAASWINALEAGREVGMTRRKEAATRNIGGAMARGDYTEAARLAYDAGELNSGLTLQKYGDAEKAKGRKKAIRQQYASDPDGAMKAALDEDEELYKDLKDLTDEADKQRYAQFGAILRTIGRQPEDRWDDEIAANRGQLVALKVPEQEIDAFISADQSGRRAMMAAMLARADQFDKYETQGNTDRTFAATEADRATDNARAAEQLKISRGQLAVSQGQLSLSKQREGRISANGASDGEWEEF